MLYNRGTINDTDLSGPQGYDSAVTNTETGNTPATIYSIKDGDVYSLPNHGMLVNTAELTHITPKAIQLSNIE